MVSTILVSLTMSVAFLKMFDSTSKWGVWYLSFCLAYVTGTVSTGLILMAGFPSLLRVNILLYGYHIFKKKKERRKGREWNGGCQALGGGSPGSY